jgi:hypothetical protein
LNNKDIILSKNKTNSKIISSLGLIKGVINKNDMKWKYQMYNKNYLWLYKVFLSKRSNIFSEELQKKESSFFFDLLIKQEKGIFSLVSKGSNYDINKERTSELMNITPYFWGFRRGHYLNDNTKVFNNVLTIKSKEKLRKYYKDLIDQKYKDHSLYSLLTITNKSQKIKKMGLKQIINEKYSNIVSRRMENKLTIPHYFFSNRYIWKSNIIPQIKNWPNTIYSYIKPTIVNIKYFDLITTDLIRLFFNPSLLKRKVIKGNISEWKVFAGISIAPIKMFGKFMNEVVRFTSNRSQSDIKNVIRYNNHILSLPWIKRELAWAKIFRKFLKARRNKLEKGFTPKRAVLFNKDRNIWLSKPLFKHTASNVIIDLYLFNNKSYKLGKYHHMLKVRAIYKYMYSMYANYNNVIQNILSRPRIFYINIIDPKMFEYYSRVIQSYESALILLSKNQFLYFLLSILKWNLSNKVFAYLFKFNPVSIFTGYINNSNSVENKELNNNYDKPIGSSFPIANNNYNNNTSLSSGLFDKWINRKSSGGIQQYIPLKWNNKSNNVYKYIFRSLRSKNKINKYRSVYDNEKNNIFINDHVILINNSVYKVNNKNIHNLSWWKNEYYLLKELGVRYNIKAMNKQKEKEAEINAITPVKEKDYPLWSKELILDKKEKKQSKFRRIKIFGRDKYTLNKYKWELKKGKKWKNLSPKFWDQQLMKYNKFSIAEKANTNPNHKWVYDNKTKLKVHISKYQVDNLIFDKIKNKINYTKNRINFQSNQRDIPEFSNSFDLNSLRVKDVNMINRLNYNKNGGELSNSINFNKIKNNLKGFKVKENKAYIAKWYLELSECKNFNNTKLEKTFNNKDNKINKINNKSVNILELVKNSNSSVLGGLANNIRGKRKMHTTKLIPIINNKYAKLSNKLIYKIYGINKYSNMSEQEENIKIKRKDKYIKVINDNYKTSKRYKINMIVKVNNIIENNKNELSSVLNFKNKIKWDKLDRSIIKMILILINNSNKRMYNNIKTYLKLKRNDVGRGREKSEKQKKLEANLNINNNNLNKKHEKLNKKIEATYKNYIHYSYERLVGAIRNKYVNSDKLYIDTIKEEFYKINRDVVVSKRIEYVNYESDTLNNSYELGYSSNNLNTTFTLMWNDVRKFSLKLWKTLNFNNREESLMHILNFSDNAFKPYYRYMIRLFILNEYRKFINRLGFKSVILHFNLPILFNKFTWFKNNNFKILNFIVVRTLFNLFAFNYRSLYILKPKFYYINKFRIYKRKAKRLNFNTWLRSTKYLKILRKAPNNYWLRYHKLINKYFKRIINYAKWDAERKVLIPYVLYFEDVLYNIYGKLALVRIWPLKRYFLSIYILSERLMLLLDKNAHRKKRRKSLTSLFTRFVFKFIHLINKTKIDKVYESNLGNNSKWPIALVNEINKNLPSTSNYNKLEYFSEKLDLSYTLNTYVFKYGELDDFISIPNYNYSKMAKKFFHNLKGKRLNMKKLRLDVFIKKGFMKYWTKPIRNILLQINYTQDIKGIQFRLGGRAKGRQRKFHLLYQRGSFLGTRHYNKLLHKYITISSSYVRNSVKATMEQAHKFATFPAGSANLKVWYASLLSSDIMELLFYMLKKKNIYNALMNRNFFVHKNVKYFINYNKWIKEYNKSLFKKLSNGDHIVNHRSKKYFKLNKKKLLLNC